MRHPQIRLPAALLPYLLIVQTYYLANTRQLFLCHAATYATTGGERYSTTEERQRIKPLQTFFSECLGECASLTEWVYRKNNLRESDLMSDSERRQLRIEWMEWLIANVEDTPC